jgi:hypothetical protein
MAKSKKGRPAIDLAGKVFGRLTVIKRSLKKRSEKETHVYWVCECECGNVLDVRGSRLKSGRTKSCGCLRHDTRPALTHGMTGTKTHMVWDAMRQRCNNPNHFAYERYGGRGIIVCQEWSDSFERFIEDMGLAPEGMTLDRIDNSKGYFKENCRWTSRKVQARNRRSNVYANYKGKRMILADIAEAANVSRGTASRWNKKYGGEIP